MAQYQQKLDAQRTTDGARSQRPSSDESGFKPVALPALVAAVRGIGARPSPQPSRRNVPTILREDALIG